MPVNMRLLAIPAWSRFYLNLDVLPMCYLWSAEIASANN